MGTPGIRGGATLGREGTMARLLLKSILIPLAVSSIQLHPYKLTPSNILYVF